MIESSGVQKDLSTVMRKTGNLKGYGDAREWGDWIEVADVGDRRCRLKGDCFVSRGGWNE